MQTLSWIFNSGLDTRCSAPWTCVESSRQSKEACTAANCCGVHIHAGTDCSDGATIGGHYWNSEIYSTDPWLYIMLLDKKVSHYLMVLRYNTSTMPAVAGQVVVATGYDAAKINHRAFVTLGHRG